MPTTALETPNPLAQRMQRTTVNLQAASTTLFDMINEQADQGSPPETFQGTRKRLNLTEDAGIPDPAHDTPAHADSGMRALEFLARTSSNIEHVNFRGTDYILDATSIKDTDAAIFMAHDRKIHTAHDFLLRWACKDPEFKKMIEKFQVDLKDASGAALRTLLESAFEHIVRSKHASVELATKCIIDMITRGARANQNYADMIKTHQKGAHVLMFNEAYLTCDHQEYETVFRPNCLKRKLDTSSKQDIIESLNTSQMPGIQRLTNTSEKVRVTAWSWYLVDVIAYLCGPMQKDAIDIKAEMAKYFCTADPRNPHPLRMSVAEDGSLVDIHQWFLDEAQAMKRIELVSTVLGITNLRPMEYDRVGNAIRCMHPDFKEKWDLVFETSTSVPADVVVPKGKWPILSWDLMKTLMEEVQVRVRKDLPGRARRASNHGFKKLLSPAVPTGGSQTPSRGDKNCRICSGTHTTATCPNKVGKTCEFFARHGRCKFADKCRMSHAVPNAASTPDQSSTQAAAGAAKAVKFSVDTKKAESAATAQSNMSSYSCVDKQSADCTGTFTLDMTYWKKKVDVDGWDLPKSCDNCRKHKRATRAANYSKPSSAPANSSLFTAIGQHDSAEDEYEEADDDYFNQYSMSMSDFSETAMVAATSTECEPAIPRLADDNLHEFSWDEIDRMFAELESEFGDNASLMTADDMDELPSDHNRYLLRQKVKDRAPISKVLREAAELEAQNSTFKLRPVDKKRVSTTGGKYSHDGFALLGDVVNPTYTEDKEDRAALLNSSYDVSDNSIDLGTDIEGESPEIGDACADQQALITRFFPVRLDFETITEPRAIGQTHNAFCTPEQLYTPEEVDAALDELDDMIGSPALLILSTNSDDFETCTCSMFPFDGMCTRCQQCPGCCDCYNQHMRMMTQPVCEEHGGVMSCTTCGTCNRGCGCLVPVGADTTGCSLTTAASDSMIEFMGAAGFIRMDGDWEPVAMAFDTLSMSNLYNQDHLPDPIPKEFKWEATGGSVRGAGDTRTPSKGRLIIEAFKFTNLGKAQQIQCSVIKLPKDVTLVIGSAGMIAGNKPGDRAWDIMPDLTNFRVYIISLHEIVRLDWLPKVVRRLRMPPICILSMFGGIETQISVLKELGFRVKLVFSIEKDPCARETASNLHPELRHADVCDIEQFKPEQLPDGVEWFAITGGPPCQRSSRRNAKPTVHLELFQAMQAVADHVLATCDAHVVYENVVPHPSIAKVQAMWDGIVGMTSQRHNAIRSGSLAVRDRLYWSNSVHMDELATVTHRCPEVCFEQGWHPTSRPLPTVMAQGDKTEYPIELMQFNTRALRLATSDERDTINPGLPPGCSGSGPSCVRNVGNGNAFSADVLWHIAREWDVGLRVPYSLMTADDLYAASPDSLELFFANICTTGTKGDRPAAILAYMTKFASKHGKLNDKGLLQMPQLDLVVNEQNTIPFQVPHPCDVPAFLSASAEYAMEMMIRDGTHQRVGYKPAYWICMLFFQPKGRKVTALFDGVLFKKGDELEALRPLKDQRPVNAATAKCIPKQWGEHSPDRSTVFEQIPADTTHFKKYDAQDAYHTVELTDRTADLSVSKCRIMRKIEYMLRSLRGSQGNAAMGTFFPAWSYSGNCFFLGTAWLEWWLEHIDDVLAHASSEERCQLRYEILVAVKHLMGLRHTPKYDSLSSPCTSREEHVGFLWTPQGHCIGDKSMEFLMHLLAQRPGGGLQAMRLRGSINQCITAFAWTPDETHFILHLLQPLNDCIKIWQASKIFSWGTPQEEAIQTMLDRMQNQPRRYAHPSWVISEERCLVGQGDWDPAGVSWHLFSVGKCDAAKVTPEDLHNPDLSVLLTMHTKAFNSSQRRWHTFEGEMFAHIHGLRKCGKYLNTCLAPYVDKSAAKYAWGSDSTVTIFRLPKLTLPELKIDHLSAKVQRFIGWSEEAAMTRYWPSTRLHTPGVVNCLADAAVRIVRQLQMAYPNLLEVDNDDVDRTEHDEVTCLPVAIHTYAAGPTDSSVQLLRVVGMPVALPDSTAAYTMLLTTEQWHTVEEAYEHDHAEYCGVKLSEVFAAICNRAHAANSITSNRIKQWRNRVFYPVHIAGDAESDADDIQVLYTPSAMTLNVGVDNHLRTYPDLVLVVPDRTEVRISKVALEDFPWEADDKSCDWSRWYLREDLIWIAHNGPTPHASLTHTMATVKEQAYWPGMEEDCRRHIDSCALCLPLRSPRISVNLGQTSNQRFKVMQMDDYILSHKVQNDTGYYSVFTMTELAAGATVFAPRKTKLAREACLIVYTRWITHYGTPEIISSDLDPALIGQLASFMCNMIGVRDRINVTQGLHCPQAEHRNRYLSEAISCAEAKGDLTTPEGLLLTVANAQIRATQIVCTDGATVFERLHGTPPASVGTIVSAARMTVDQVTEAIAKARPDDKAFMRQLHNRCEELIAYHVIKMDQRARYNLSNNLAKQSNLLRTDFGFAEGQTAAVGDQVYTILDIPKVADNAPIAATVRSSSGKVLTMLLSKMQPLATDRPETTSSGALPGVEHVVKVGDLIFYEDDTLDKGLLAGVVTCKTDDELTVHLHQPRAGVKTWLPRWEDPKRTNIMLRKKSCPQGCRPFMDSLTWDRIVTKGAFSGPGKALSDDTIYHLRSMGYATSMVEPEGTTPGDHAMCIAYEDPEYQRITEFLHGGAVSPN